MSALLRWIGFGAVVSLLYVAGGLMVAPAAPLKTRAGLAATPTGKPKDGFQELLQPFLAEAMQQRARRADHDPAYAQRIDAELNRNRINFLLVGYGETHEPPYEKDTIGSISIFTLNYRKWQVAEISVTHDARAPEIERYRLKRGMTPKLEPSKIDRAYKIGGFSLMRTAVENATGLAIDFQLVLADAIIKRLVDEVLGPIKINNPFDLTTLPFYVEGAKYPGLHFPPGRQALNGLKTLGYLKALTAGDYDRAKENNLRKPLVFQAIREAVEQQMMTPWLWTKMLGWLHGEVERKTIDYDFDAAVLLIGGIEKLASHHGQGHLMIPRITQHLYLVDTQSGDGGFEWITGSQNPIIKEELTQGLYVDKAMVVPVGNANPYAKNLAAGYWTAVRQLIRQRLTSECIPDEARSDDPTRVPIQRC